MNESTEAWDVFRIVPPSVVKEGYLRLYMQSTGFFKPSMISFLITVVTRSIFTDKDLNGV